MKKVAIKNMHLVNFRGHKDLKINFSDLTEISGDNRLGKSTIFDAFVWNLFGKDQFDRKDFEIIPIVDGKRLDRVDSEVKLVIDFDGREMELKRVLHQKWVRRRGTAEEVFDGCETLYYINDVPLKAGEYKARVDLMIEETVFKLITNPSAFLALHWTKQREFLFQIAGTVSDHEIAATDAKFAQLLDLVNGKSLIEFKKELSAKKKKLKADLDDINPKIDQTANLMPTEKDFTAIQSELTLVDEKIAAIDLQIADRAKAIRGEYEAIQTKQGEINTLKTKQRELVNAATTKAQQDAFEANQANVVKEHEYSALVTLHASLKNHAIALASESDRIEAKVLLKKISLQELRDKWTLVNEKEYTAKDGCLICPAFGHECSDITALSKNLDTQETAKSSFLFTKNNDLEFINTEGGKLKDELETIEKEHETAKALLLNKQNEVLASFDRVEKLKSEIATIKKVMPKEVFPDEIPEWVELYDKIKAIEATISEPKPAENSDLNIQKGELIEKRDSLKKELNNKDLIINYKAEIKRLETEASQLSQQIADLERQEFTIDAFNKVKIDECDRRINNMFKIVKFQLFDKTNEGNEFEACIPLNKAGVQIAATNTAERINAGLDIIETLSKFYNVAAPVFIDNSEAVNSFLPTTGQMINLRVTKEKVLTIK